MNRVTRGTVVLAAAVAMLSCKGDPTGDLRNGIDHLIALPGAIFIGPDSTKTVLVEAVDKQGNRLAANFALGSVGAGITVVPDDSFNLVYNTNGQLVPPKNWTRIQYIVTGSSNSNNSSFVVTAGGKSLTIPVRLIPDTASTLTVSATAPALGDTVVATAGANFKFTPASVVSLAGASVVTLGISADSTQISFIPGPSGNGPVSVTSMVVSYATVLGGYTANSGATTVTTPPVLDFPATFSTATPSSFPTQDTVTITAGAGFKFLPTATVSIGGTAGFIISRAPDSSSIKFIPISGSTSGPATVNGVVLSFLTAVSLNIPTQSSITVAASGATTLAGAPTINIPATGVTSFYVDGGLFATAAQCGNIGNHCRFYKIVLGAPRTFNVSLTWGNTADIGGYFIDAAGNDQFGNFACDNFGSGAGGQPEACSQTLPAGTWYLALADFTAAAQNTTTVRMTLTGQ